MSECDCTGMGRACCCTNFAICYTNFVWGWIIPRFWICIERQMLRESTIKRHGEIGRVAKPLMIWVSIFFPGWTLSRVYLKAVLLNLVLSSSLHFSL